LNNTGNDQEIEQYLETVCQFFGSYSTQCTQLIQQYLPQVINYLEQGYTPAQVCQMIGFCSSTKEEKIKSNMLKLKKL